ncbi:uncharacterized protein LOC116300451 [Actinia tenebrosa]|uniref:Uncharacterized protein LOC116300451 n=1 Tax=Actinia tenebrosa TaxID=6105 RepID=A0A6P8I9D7_ACTTE|nr:uncharacterized protein LOC116300451 [Actinia tenebrosa]
MKDKISFNAKQAYAIESNVIYTEVLSHRNGSIISTFNLSYSGIDSIQVVQLLESIEWRGLFGVLPAQILTIIPDVVPIAPPTITYVSNSSSTSILLKWTQVSDVNVVGYAAFYKEEGKTFLPGNVKTVPASDQLMDVSGLKKYTNYSLVLLASSSKGNGIPSIFVNSSTDEDVPSKPPGNFKVVIQSSTSFLITWEAIAQEFVHGILLGYNVTFIKHGWDNERTPMYKIVEPGTHTLTLEDLGKFTTFTISACGFTSKGCGVPTSQVTAQTSEDVPSMPPQNFQAINLTSENSITLTWNLVPREHINGILVGYVIRYQQTSAADEKVKTGDIKTRYLGPGTRNIVFDGIPQYSVWKFQISAITNAGEGDPSSFTYGASCRCPKILYSNFFVHPPYLTVDDDGSFDGVFYNITEQMIKWACGNCKNGHGETDLNMKSNGKGGDAYKPGAIDLVDDIDDIPHISFPVYGNKYMDKYMGMYEYIHFMDSPGVVFITIDNPAGTAGQRIITAVFGCLPLLLIAVLMAVLAGFIVWFLEFRSNPEQFSPSFFSGFWDGFWWAYISMTTVGYGDRFTVTDAGKVFSMIWTLTGIVIISMLTGSIATDLTSETVEQDIMLYGAKVAAIHNSSEYRLGILKNAKVNTDKKYGNFEELKQALRARQVQGILIDLYVAAENQKSIFDSEIKIKKILDKEFGYGVVLSGASAVVQQRCRDFIKKNIADITKLIERKTKTIESNEEDASEGEEEINLFDSNSTMFRSFLMFSCAFLGCAYILGFIYHFGWYLPKRRAICKVHQGNDEKSKDNCALYKDELLQEMHKMVEEFHQTQMKKLENMKKRYKQEILQILKKEKSITNKKSFLKIGEGKILFCLKDQHGVRGLSFKQKT